MAADVLLMNGQDKEHMKFAFSMLEKLIYNVGPLPNNLNFCKVSGSNISACVCSLFVFVPYEHVIVHYIGKPWFVLSFHMQVDCM